jgi:hypothetical protein
MKHILIVLLPCLVAASLTYYLVHRNQQAPMPAAPVVLTSQGPTIERLQHLRSLVVVRVCVADVLTADGEGYRGAWLIKGDALIGVDVGKGEVVDKDEAARTATVRLPQPAVVQSRVDHERTRTWEVEKTTWVPWRGNPDRLRDEVMQHAQRLVGTAAAADENILQARTMAEAIVQGIYQEVGWQVTVEWVSPPVSQPPRK